MITFRLKRSHKIALWLVFFIAVGGILTGLYMYNLQDKDLAKVRPDFIMTASELQRAFETDEAAAGPKYINQIIELSGEVESVKPGENQTMVITLKTENPLSAVSCTLQSESLPAEFVAGNQVSLRGQCSGFLMDVLMNNCAPITREN
ncbi:hypothetical protein EG832_08065 [bacterium]|nr:hypothetical protein [bacterium]